MTGAGLTASRIGMPDIGATTLPEMAGTTYTIANINRNIPLVAVAVHWIWE